MSDKKEQVATSVAPKETVTIEENKTIKAAKYTKVVAEIKEGTVTIVDTVMPAPIDRIAKKKEVTNKKGKKVTVRTPREKIITAILTILFIGLLGGGGYYGYKLYKELEPTNYKALDKTFELGFEIPRTVDSYISIANASDTDYTLDLSNVEQDKVGTYSYTITYNQTVRTGKITITDTTAPVLTLGQDLVFYVGDELTADDIVIACFDYTDCSYTATNLETSLIGDKIVPVKATDSYGNSDVQNVTVTIEEQLDKSTCTKTVTNTSFVETITITLGAKDNKTKRAKELFTFTYTTDTAYQNGIATYKDKKKFKQDDTLKQISFQEEDNTYKGREINLTKASYQADGYTCD